MEQEMTRQEIAQELDAVHSILMHTMDTVRRKRMRRSEKAMTLAVYARQEEALLAALEIIKTD